MALLRIALLVCDTPAAGLVVHHGDYIYMFTRFLTNGLAKSGLDYSLKLVPYDVTKGELPSRLELANFEAVIISGGKHDAFGDSTWMIEFIEYLRHEFVNVPRNGGNTKIKPKLLGICLGHQLIARAFENKKAAVDVIKRRPAGWSFGPTVIYPAFDCQTHLPILSLAGQSSYTINSIHKDDVASIPAGFKIVFHSEQCENEGMLSSDESVLTFQGHPETTFEFVENVAKMRMQAGTVPEEVYNDLLSRRNIKLCHDAICKLILKFIVTGLPQED